MAKKEKTILEKVATFVVKTIGTGAATGSAVRDIRSGPRKIDEALDAATGSNRKQRKFN